MKRLAWIAAPALLAACASGPESAALHPPPQTSVASSWQAPMPTGSAAVDLAQWWSQVDDPLLPVLIDAAQSVSPTVSAAASRIAAARAAVAVAGADVSLQANASALRGRPDPAGVTSTSLAMAGELRWDLDPFGARRAGQNAAEARLAQRMRQHHLGELLAADRADPLVGLDLRRLQHVRRQLVGVPLTCGAGSFRCLLRPCGGRTVRDQQEKG